MGCRIGCKNKGGSILASQELSLRLVRAHRSSILCYEVSCSETQGSGHVGEGKTIWWDDQRGRHGGQRCDLGLGGKVDLHEMRRLNFAGRNDLDTHLKVGE